MALTETLEPTKGREPVDASRVASRHKLFNRICAGVLIAFALIWLVPVLWALDTALKPNEETTRTTWLIENPTFDAFGRVLLEPVLELQRPGEAVVSHSLLGPRSRRRSERWSPEARRA